MLILLQLQGNELGENGVKTLSKGLQTNTTLKTLDLSFNLVSRKAAEMLVETLSVNFTLTSIVLAEDMKFIQKYL